MWSLGVRCQEKLKVTPKDYQWHVTKDPPTQPPVPLYFFFFLRPQFWWPAFRPPPSSLLLCQLGMGASSSFGRPPRSGTLPIST